jgi:hypothetical protein
VLLCWVVDLPTSLCHASPIPIHLFNYLGGHVNGSRYFVKQIGQYRLVLEKLKKLGDENDILLLPRIPMTSSAGTKLPFLLKRLQFPVKPAFALTINRSQSQTFVGKCGIILPKSIWTHGKCLC